MSDHRAAAHRGRPPFFVAASLIDLTQIKSIRHFSTQLFNTT